MGGAERKANLPQEFRNTGWYLKHVQSSASLLTSETPSQGRPQLPYLLTDDLTVPTPTHPNWQDQRWTSESTTSDYFSQDFITGTRLFQLVWNEILWSLSGVCYCELDKSTNSLALAIFLVQLSHPYTTTGKTIALTIQIFISSDVSAFKYAI